MKNDISHGRGFDFLRPVCERLFGSVPELQHYWHSDYHFLKLNESDAYILAPHQVLYSVF